MILFVSMALAAPAPACPAHPEAELEIAMRSIDHLVAGALPGATLKSRDHQDVVGATKALNTALSCLDDIPAQNVVSRLHQTMALASFGNGELDAAKGSLITARIMDPSWKLSDSVFPPEHPYADLYKRATHAGELGELPPIEPEIWIVDGIEATQAPAERAFLLQVSKAGRIVWSGYLWNLDGVPSREPEPLDPRDPPYVLRLGASVTGGAHVANQTVEPAGDIAWSPESGTTPAAGVELVARYTPQTRFGVEVAGSVLGPVDPIEGGGAAPAARAVVLIGAATWVGELQPYGAARIGGAIHPIRAWTAESSGPTVWTVPSVIVGVEGGVRSDTHRLGGTVDTGWVFDAERPVGLSTIRVQVDGGMLITGPLAVEALIGVRHVGLPYFDPTGGTVGHRRDFDVHLGAGVAVWY